MDRDRQSRLVIAAAREIRDGELVMVSEPLGRAALALAQLTHAPRATALHPAGRVAVGSGNSPSMLTDLQGVMSLLQQGRVDLGFIAPGEVDRFGNVNSTRFADPAAGAEFLLAGGPAADIACLARRTVILLAHEPARLKPRLDYVTGPGYGDGRGYRARIGLPPGGPSAIITDLAVFRFAEEGPAYLASLHPGVSLEEARAATGFALDATEVAATPPPTVQELNLLSDVLAAAGELTAASGA